MTLDEIISLAPGFKASQMAVMSSEMLKNLPPESPAASPEVAADPTKEEMMSSYLSLRKSILGAEKDTMYEKRSPQTTYISTTTYSALGCNPVEFRALITRLSKDIPEIMQMVGADAVAVRGTSGYSVAFAMRMLTDIPFIIARKQGEGSHGCNISMFDDGGGKNITRYIVLDDLTCSGRTFQGITRDLHPAACVALVEYCKLKDHCRDSKWKVRLQNSGCDITDDGGNDVPYWKYL